MQSPDGPDDDGEDLGPPLPPEDRLWRHPSEVGAAAMSAGATPFAPPPPAAPVAPPRVRRGASPWLVGAVAGVVGAVTALAVVVALGGFDDPVIEHDVLERVASPPPATLPIGIRRPTTIESVSELVHGLSPALARLEVVRPAEGDTPGTTTTTGTAVMFRDDGYLLTSSDLIAHAASVTIVLHDGSLDEGVVVGTDPVTDVAVLKVEGEGLPTAVLGSADDLTVGQPALIVGSPSSTDQEAAVTSGIVSALGRTVPASASAEDGTVPTRHDMIQSDAPLDPAATGGAMIDARGAVVGIIADPPDEATGDGLSFATPIDTALAVATDIITTGSAHHPWLGIEGSDIEARTADELELDGGAKVATVAEGSPAAVAGLHPHDVITSVGTVTVHSMADLVVALRRHRPGEQVLIAYLRDGRTAFCIATLGEM